MLHSATQRSLAPVTNIIQTLGYLIFILLALAPVQAAAQSRSCNPDLDFTVITPGPYFLGDTLRISADLGAKDIAGGSYQDIYAFGYALNCRPGQNFASCTPEGNTVEFRGNLSTSCLNSNGQPAQLQFPESNVIPITTVGYPIRTAPNSQCNVQFDFSVLELDSSPAGDNLVIQAMGWPLAGEKATTCSNGLTSAASSTIGFRIQACDIELDKQVSLDGETWFDADNPASAPVQALGGDAEYRLVIRNTGTVAYVQPIPVVDPNLGINTTVPALAAGQEVVLTGGQIAQLTASGACAVVGTLQNTANVQGVCRSGGAPISASAQDSAYLVCSGAPAIDIEKATNGQDADTPTGPQVPVGGAVTWTYQVTNTGSLPLTNVAVGDSDIGAVTCPKNTLAIGESMTCSANGTAIAGQYANVGSVTADSSGGSVNDSDPSHYFGVAAAIDIEKATNGQDADTPTGPQVAVGSAITWTYVVTNAGNVALTAVAVSDDQLGAITCPKSTLAVGESMICTANGTATSGQYANLGSVTGTPPVGPPVTDSDPSHYIGMAGGIDIRKEIWDGNAFVDANNAASAPVAHWPAGAVYRIIVRNTGAVDLDQVVVNDPTLGIVNYSPLGVGGAGTLAAGEQVTITAGQVLQLDQETRCESSGNFQNVASANGELVGTDEGVSDSDSAWLRCVGTPALTVLKEISIDDGQTWIDDTAGPVEWPSGALYRITVENTGNVKLVNVTVSDTLIGPPDYAIGELDVGEMVVVTDGEWLALDVAEVCDSSGTIENIATVTGTSDELASDEVTETDNAKLQCIGPPMIAILKEVSLDNGATWHDANAEPFPTAVTDPLNPVTALYRITVSNVGDVPLTGVVVSDPTLGIVNYAPLGAGGPGTLGVAETVVIDSGDIAALTVQNRCVTAGEKANVASAEGYSAVGTKDAATDPATVECNGQPAIRITKEVSADGINFEDVSTSAVAPSDAWYRITVENIGSVDLENVTISDAILGLTNVVVTGAGGPGLLAVGEVVVITHVGGGGDNEVADLYVPGLCTSDEVIENTAIADGKSVASVQTVTDDDDATLSCVGFINICDNGRPTRLKMMYDADDDSDNDQGAAFTASPVSVNFPATPITIKTYNKQGMALLDTFTDVSEGGMFYVEDPSKSGKIPPTVVIEFWNGSTLLQTIQFHGSCSAPLNFGDEYSAATIVGASW